MHILQTPGNHVTVFHVQYQWCLLPAGYFFSLTLVFRAIPPHWQHPCILLNPKPAKHCLKDKLWEQTRLIIFHPLQALHLTQLQI